MAETRKILLSFDDGPEPLDALEAMHVQRENAKDLQGLIDLLKQSGFTFASP